MRSRRSFPPARALGLDRLGVKVLAPEDRKAGQIFREVEPEDLLKYRLIPEFVGRLPMVATFEDLDEPSLKLILTQPKKTLVKHDQRLCEMGALIHPATLVASFRWCLGDSQVRRCFVRCGQAEEGEDGAGERLSSG